MAIFICPFTWFYLHCQQPYSYSRQGEMKTGRLIPISSYILIILLNFQAPRNIVRRELHKIFKQGQDAELTWVWLQQNFQFCAIWESGTKSTRDNGRTCNFNCLPFMSWSAPQLSSFLLPSPEMLTSVSDLFTHISFYVFEVCPLLSQGAIEKGEKNESFSRSPKFKYKNNTSSVGCQWPKHAVKHIHVFIYWNYGASDIQVQSQQVCGTEALGLWCKV